MSVIGEPIHSSTQNLQHAKPLNFDSEYEVNSNCNNSSSPVNDEPNQSDESDSSDPGIEILIWLLYDVV